MCIQIKKLGYKIKDRHILKDINLEINQGEILSILGPNGSGKSSLIKILAGDFPQYNGSILIDKKNLRNIDIKEQAKIRSVMSQSQEIVYDYSVKDIVEMGWINIEGEKNNSLQNALEKVCYECDINKIITRKYNSLSGGEQRSVNFARCLIQLSIDNKNKSRYLILDEPTANLDIPHKISMMNILIKKKQEGFGIILVLHDLNLANKFSDKIALMKNGKLQYLGNKEIILNDKNLSNIYDTPIIVDKLNNTIKYY